MRYPVRTLVAIVLSLFLGLVSKEWTLFVQALPVDTLLKTALVALPLLALGTGSALYMTSHPERG